jgi:hypothetical protein
LLCRGADQGRMVVVICDGCNEPDADETLWLDGPLGLSAVRVHRDRDCAQRARVARGGGRFVRPAGEDALPLPVRALRDEGLLAACQEYAVEWRRCHSIERVDP